MPYHPEKPANKYNGPLYYYIFCSLYRNPSYLQRNLTKVLAAEERDRSIHCAGRTSNMNKKDQDPPSRPGPQPADAEPALSARAWSFLEIQNIIEQNQIGAKDPVLRVDITDIKDRLAKFKDKNTSREPASKRTRPPATAAFCTLTIWHPSLKSPGNLVELEKCCQIYPATLPNDERGATVSLEEPFEIRIDQLRPRDGTPLESLKDSHYSMQFMLSAANEGDKWPPMDTRTPVPKQAISYADSRLTRFPVLVAKWGRLPQTPGNVQESLLEMVAIQDAIRYKPKLSLKIDMKWVEGHSQLEQANAEFKASTKTEPLEPQVALTTELNFVEWIFVNGSDRKSHKSPEHHCALCHRNGDDGRRHSKNLKGLERLYIHVKNDHPLYKFSFSPNASAGFVGEIMVVPSNDYDVRTQAKPDIREMDWVRPPEAFDINTYLDGDETWAGGKNKRGSMSGSARPRLEESRSKSHEHVKPVTLGPASSRAPEDTPDVVKPVRQKFKVPRAPAGVKFYRQPSMRAVEEGEELTETDDEIDEEWLLQKHADGIDSFSDITASEKELIKVFDRHMAKEDFSSDLHAVEAMYRFCRQHKPFLQRPDILRNFNALLVGRKVAGSITLEHIHNCIKIIHAPPPADEMDVDPPKDAEPLRERANFGDVQPEGAHEYGRCAACRKFIHDPRQSIRCSNPLCPKSTHHLACVSLDSRPPRWLCAPCRTNPARAPSPPLIILSAAADGPPPPPATAPTTAAAPAAPAAAAAPAGASPSSALAPEAPAAAVSLPVRAASPAPPSEPSLPSEPGESDAPPEDDDDDDDDDDSEDGSDEDGEEDDSEYDGPPTEDESDSLSSRASAPPPPHRTPKPVARPVQRGRDAPALAGESVG